MAVGPDEHLAAAERLLTQQANFHRRPGSPAATESAAALALAHAAMALAGQLARVASDIAQIKDGLEADRKGRAAR